MRRKRSRTTGLPLLICLAMMFPCAAQADTNVVATSSPVVALVIRAPDAKRAEELFERVREGLVRAGVSRVITAESLGATYLASWQPESSNVDPSYLMDFVLVVSATKDARGKALIKLWSRSVAPLEEPLEVVVRDGTDEVLTADAFKIGGKMLESAQRHREQGTPPIVTLSLQAVGGSGSLAIEAQRLLITNQNASSFSIGLREGTYQITASCADGSNPVLPVALAGDRQLVLPCSTPVGQHYAVPLPQGDRRALPIGTSKPPIGEQFYSISLGFGGGKVDKSSFSWTIGGDGPVFHRGPLYWNTGRFRFVMNAEGANEVVLAPLLGTLGGVGMRTDSGEMQIGMGPGAGLLMLEKKEDRSGYNQFGFGLMSELGYLSTFKLSERERGGVWIGAEGLGMLVPGHERSLFVGMLVGRFAFMSGP